jgi:DNA-binding Xre family transcriptional regulator
MKGLKLSKTSWLILSAGVFLVALAGLGLTRSQQLHEQTRLDDEVGMSEKRLATLQTAQLSQNLENLRVKVEEGEAQLKEAQARLRQTVVSVDITDEFFKIAEYCSVNVTNLSTTTISQTKYENITLSTISLTANVIGKKQNIINFVIGLNNDYVTGNVQSTQITFHETYLDDGTEESEEDSATVGMIIYSYEGP